MKSPKNAKYINNKINVYVFFLTIFLIFITLSLSKANKISKQTCGGYFNYLSAREKNVWANGYLMAYNTIPDQAKGFYDYPLVIDDYNLNSEKGKFAIHFLKTFADWISYIGSEDTIQRFANNLSSACKKNPKANLKDTAFEVWYSLEERD